MVSNIEKSIGDLEKLKQVALYRYSQGQTTDLKEIIDLEKLSLSIDRKELVNSKKREEILMQTMTEIMKLNNNLETVDIVKNMIGDMIIQTGLDPLVYEKFLKNS